MFFLSWILIIFYFILAVFSAGHALLYKKDSRAALGWIAVCLTFPLMGSLLYFLFGINRIRTRAQKLKAFFPFQFGIGTEESDNRTEPEIPGLTMSPGLSEILRISRAVTRRPVVGGNSIQLHLGSLFSEHHDRAFAVLPFDLADCQSDCFLFLLYDIS